MSSRFGEESKEMIRVKQISVPDLGEILDLGRHENFSLFIQKHRRIAGRLINIFLGMRDVDDLLAMAVYARDRVNPYLFNYALSVTLLHRDDTKDVSLPNFAESFPDKFLDSKVFTPARESLTVLQEGNRAPIIIPLDYTASNLEEEHRLAYFREDLGINLHHWHWHLVYPFEGDRSVVAKNRRGELFYYMHQQVMARYNFERLCNGLKRVVRFSKWTEPIEEAYFPKLDSVVASRAWPARVSNQTLSDLKREVDQITQDVSDLQLWNTRILDAIHSGNVTMENGQTIQLSENEGI